ncbi:MAG: response regulator [Nitrospinota bacterium]
MDRYKENRFVVILLGEDDPADQELIRRALKDSSLNHELNILNDGEEVLNYLFRNGKYKDLKKYRNPDIIVLDLNMPKFDGVEILEQISKDPLLKVIPSVILTTSNEKRDVLKCYELGANSYITKPSDLGQLIKTVKLFEDYWFSTVSLPDVRRSR